jgi:NDP-sugar pyrophosphorylase family protein
MESLKIFILAGGLGTRIRPLFPECPKPLVPIHHKPFLEWQIQLLASQGFDQFVLCVGYLSNQIIEYFGDGSRWNVHIEYSIEDQQLGTGGAIHHARKYFKDTILLLNGDTYLDTNYQNLLSLYSKCKDPNLMGSLSLDYREDTDRYGRVEINDSGDIISFTARSPNLNSGWVNAGAYLLEPKILEFIQPDTALSLEQDILPAILQSGALLKGIDVNGSFIDMGTPEGYARLEQYLHP